MTIGVSSQPTRRLAPRERVELILSQLDRLPTLPAVAARLLSVTSSNESSAGDVVEIIESDAALTAIVLRLVRRADLGVHGEALNVRQAVVLLGFSTVRNAVLSVQLCEAFPIPDDTGRLGDLRRGLWEHALAVACLSELLGDHIGGSEFAGGAFVCGLLHDVGKIALDACMPKSYARVLQRVDRQAACICDAEREVFGLDHTVAGKTLARRWKLPEPILECVWLHHQGASALPSSVSHQRLVRLVHLADNLIRRAGMGFSGYQYVCDVDQAGEALGLGTKALTGLLNKVPARMKPFVELTGLDDPNGHADYTARLTAANEQLGRINTKLTEANRKLEVRSVVFAALEGFTKVLGSHHGVGDVCVSAAETMRSLVGADCAVAFHGQRESRCIHLACAATEENRRTVSVIGPGEWPEPADWARIHPAASAPRLVPAPAACAEIWLRAAGSSVVDPLWLLPLTAADGVIGGLLVAARDERVSRFRLAVDECEALATAIALAMVSAKHRTESERMNEELLDLNRRLSAAQQEVVRARSISMIAAMAAGAAHELNNPLSVVSGRAQMELGTCDDPESARALQIIIDQTQRATQIVTDLMQFAKPEPPQPAVHTLGSVLEPLCQHWRDGSALRDDQITLSVADPEATVYADRGQLEEILDAVMGNALEATDPKAARLHINSPSRASDETVRIVVVDNGVGMEREVLEHALDPFFSHRPAGRGRGLGLSQAYRLAEINGGRLSLESTPRVGTSVTLELPARVPTS